MPGYTPPSHNQLITDTQNISYNNDQNNPVREEQVILLKSLPALLTKESNAPDILIGAWIFVHEAIQQSYASYGLSYIRSANHSELFTLTKKTPLLSDTHSLEDTDKFIYLAAFCEFLAHHPNLVKDEMRKQIYGITKSFKEKLKEKINQLCARLPSVQSVRHNFKNLSESYREECKGYDLSMM